MKKNWKQLEAFEAQLLVEEKVDFERNLRLYEAMWEEAVALGVFPLSNPYDGLEDDIRLASILNRSHPTTKHP